MPRWVAALLATSWMVGADRAEAHEPPADSDPALVRFQAAIEGYAALHRRLRGSLPRLETESEPGKILKAADRLASAVRAARPGARQGDLFTPEVVASFRARIRRALGDRRQEVVRMLTEVEEDEAPPAGWRPAVNGSLDWFSTGPTPPSILNALPPLPSGLQYRFVGRDLVLLDVDANLIVDILAEAVSAE